MRTQGKLTGVDLRDFLRAGVPLIQELAKNLNVSEMEIKKMVSQGKIGFADVERAFETMTSAGGKFHNMLSQKATGRNQAKVAMTLAGESIGKALLPALNALGEIVKSIAEAIQKFVEKNKVLSTVLFSLVGVGGLVITAFTTLGAILPIVTAGASALGISLGALARPL